MRSYTELRDRVRGERAAEIDAWEAGNLAQAKDVRARYDADCTASTEQNAARL